MSGVGRLLSVLIAAGCVALVLQEAITGSLDWGYSIGILLLVAGIRLAAYRLTRPAPAWLERRMPSKNPDDYT